MTPTPSESAAAQRLAQAILDLMLAVESGRKDRQPPPRPAPTAPHTLEPYLLTMQQAAEYLSVSAGTVFNRTAPRGRIPAVRIGASVRYRIDDLKAEVERCRVTGSST